MKDVKRIINRYIAFVIACIICISTVPGEQVLAKQTISQSCLSEQNSNILHSGKSGGLDWSIDADGLLTISGNGDYIDAAWCAFADKIERADVFVSGITNTSGMFYNCSNLTSVDFESFDTSKVVDMTDMFFGCSSLKQLDLSGLDFGALSSDVAMFGRCDGLTEIILPNHPVKINFRYCDSIYDNTNEEYDKDIHDCCEWCRWSNENDDLHFILCAEANQGEVMTYRRTLELADDVCMNTPERGFVWTSIGKAKFQLDCYRNACSTHKGVKYIDVDVYPVNPSDYVMNTPEWFPESFYDLYLYSYLAEINYDGKYYYDIESYTREEVLPASGVSGDLKWSIDELGHLKISGKGDYTTILCKGRPGVYLSEDKYLPEWCSYASYIKSAEIQVSDFTNIDGLLELCEAVESIDFSGSDFSSVLPGKKAIFIGFDNLEKVVLPNVPSGVQIGMTKYAALLNDFIAPCNLGKSTTYNMNEGCFLINGHSYSEPEFIWNGTASAIAKMVCTRDNCIVSGKEVEVSATISENTIPATTETEGKIVYTAMINYYGKVITDTKTITIPKLEKNDEIVYEEKTEEKAEEKSEEKKVGESLKSSNSIFKVTNSSKKEPTVQYVAPISKKTKNVKIPDTVKVGDVTYKVTAIAPNAFKNNKKVSNVTIGKNIKSIGKGAFSGCKKLKKITIKSKKLKSIGKNALKGINKNATIDVPNNKVKAYKKLFKKNSGFKKTMKIK